MIEFTFVTQSSNKVDEAERILGIKLNKCNLKLPEIQAVEIQEVVEHKVQYAYNALGGKPVMVEDTGLFIEAWNGLPGALIKWFVDKVGVNGICKMMREFPNKNARAVTIVAAHDGEIHTFLGEVKGRIALNPSGSGGFGWDRVFIPDFEGSQNKGKTFADMSSAEKDAYSMRRLALQSMVRYYEL